MTLSRFALTLVIGLSSGMLTYLMAAGMSLIISGMGIINFGQGAFYILGAYVCNQIFTAMGLPFGLALLGGFVVTALLGGVLERLLRPVFGKDMIFSLLITMGASYIICDSMIMVWGNKVKATGLPKFLSGAVMIPFTKIVFPILLSVYHRYRSAGGHCLCGSLQKNHAGCVLQGHYQRQEHG